ncbi:hypothetical protein GGG16DRAFT_107919 [Schizophyllum commune]
MALRVPAIITIDIFTCRQLLLIDFPLMLLALWFTGASFNIPAGSTARTACVALGTYLDCIAYSPSEGPVPFTYSAESFPLYISEIIMSWAVSGAFFYYGAWNLFGFVTVFFFLPETKGFTLEELDTVFSVLNRKHASYQFRMVHPLLHPAVLFSNKSIEKEPLYPHEKMSLEERMAHGTFAPAAALVVAAARVYDWTMSMTFPPMLAALYSQRALSRLA